LAQHKVLIVGVLASTAFGVLAFTVASWTNTSVNMVRELDSRINRQIERIDHLHEMVARFEVEMRRLGHPVALQMADAEKSVETAPEDDATTKQVSEAVEIAEDTPLMDGDSVLPDWQQPLVSEYEREWGQSGWGRSAADAIEQAIPDHPFFGRYDGSFVTDCKEKTCRVEWLFPRLEELSAEDRDELLSMARYEMLALAAANATDVGQLTTDWTMENEFPTSIITTFRKRAESGP
jgi:hypothetical protein